MAEKTLRKFSIPSVANVPIGPTINVSDANFELKLGLIKMVQASPFCGLPSMDANADLQQFLVLCDTIIMKGVTPEVIRI
jgi:hypothetical protein